MIKKLILILFLTIISLPTWAIKENIVIGNSSASVELKLYYSMTCPACGRFHEGVLEKIKTEFVDTNIAKIEYVPYPLDHLSFGIEAYLACIKDKNDHYDAMSKILSTQKTWLNEANPGTSLNDLLLSYMTEDEVLTCQTDKKSLQDTINRIDSYKQKQIIRGTPSLFVNGKPAEPMSYDNIKKMIEEYTN